MATSNDKRQEEIEVFKGVNQELKRFYDFVCRSFEHVRNKALALMVGEVAIVTFLFLKEATTERFISSLPSYGIVIYSLGVTLLIAALVMYFITIATIVWPYPTEEHDMKNPSEKFKGDELEFQRYIHTEYMKKIPVCASKLKEKSIWFMRGTYALASGIFFVVLVKYGGGA